MNTIEAVTTTNLSLQGRRSGKVRDTYQATSDAGEELIVVVATDRISAFDVVLPTPIPGKGRLLTEISSHWFRFIEGRSLCSTYVLGEDPAMIGGLSEEERALIEGRVTIGKRCNVVPIECVARGYLAGSGWGEYQQSQSVCGIELPPGLTQCDQLPEPIFTPATKAEQGEHDENISFERACEIVGTPVMERLRTLTLEMYSQAADYARERGIILADTKFEFGMPVGEEMDPEGLILIDEALTPDSSRFWPASEYEPGRDQPSFDKQYVREYLLGRVKAGEWDKSDPGPELPPEVVDNTLAKYREARDRLFA